MDYKAYAETMESFGYSVHVFDTAAEAADWLCGEIRGERVAFGGSVTLQEMGLYERLSENNEVLWHWVDAGARRPAREASVYITSINAAALTGEIVNIDGSGNRVAATMDGPQRLYLVFGENKLTLDMESAIRRAREVAAPLNAQRLGTKTPCAVDGKCHDCRSPGRICRALTVLWRRPFGIAKCEIVLVREKLGY
ncbi:MAG: lactate utilization protein [Clostridia bacterium]|nr:lactate utilization protein [Clostridia bacterium]